jgi:hypothetical protein
VEYVFDDGAAVQKPPLDADVAADHPGAQISFDPVDRAQRRGLEKSRLELLTVGAVVDPFAASPAVLHAALVAYFAALRMAAQPCGTPAA